MREKQTEVEQFVERVRVDMSGLHHTVETHTTAQSEQIAALQATIEALQLKYNSNHNVSNTFVSNVHVFKERYVSRLSV